ncbi:Crp/Fnr family transcriptional regulator [Novosphingobium sp. THN1]|uniref:Crp/Fnr family transcriptional regulator n=1 Tax=unclassified Novosphingobium TaxID=2644732 RepID=UPI000E4A06F4|nr:MULTISPECIES: Crp/Fnr family transcriptional regulator [unclassified Novosphingobium]AXU19659.1 Crp/Fnr family transcriptional regulator [Novosphingobium sp. THN1]MBA4086674.1 Crp/Fnr family transcriptional regulator [Novosphingobium sp.]NLR38569.1 Crp/Fnr family transcriptional regulator [Novosphingobium sp. ERW19]
MDAAKLAEALTAQSLFADCEPAELSDIIARGQVRQFKPGQELMAQGEEGKTLFIVLKGLARVSMLAANGREIILDYAEPGHVLGEIAFLDGGDRTATVEAIEPVEALILTRGAFADIIDKHKGLALRLLKAMARRLRQNNAVIEADRAYTSGPRLARFLLRLMMGDTSDAGNQLKIALSQGELGNFAGMSREQINRQLSAWVDNGIIALKGGRVTILDREALIDVAEAW